MTEAKASDDTRSSDPHEETRILELLNKTGAMLASKLDLQVLVQTVTDTATDLCGAQFGAFFYTATNDTGDVFTLSALSGAPREAFSKLGHPRATAIFGPTFRGEAVIRLDDVMADPRYGQWSPHHGMPEGHLPVRSYLAAAVFSASGEVIGGLFFGHEQAGVFSERSERLVTGIAAQAGIAIDNSRLYEQARKAADERAQLLEAERKSRIELERASLAKDEFLATLSHELRTPLNAILGWADILLARAPAGSDSRRPLETIARNARTQALLIDDLLHMSRIISGKVRLDVHEVDLATIVQAAIDAVHTSLESKDIRLRTTLDAGAGPVVGDPARLQQVVWNLLSNAVKFTPKWGSIDVTLQRVDSQVELIVRDSGIGIAPELLQHVFERFRQGDSSTSRKFGGLGLGLSIVKELVALHGGTVQAASDGPNKGSTFSVQLPIRAVREQPLVAPRPATPSSPPSPVVPDVSLAGVRVLAVDDDPDARELVGFLLESAQAEVAIAGSADDALALLKTGRFDILVSDIGMPERDGYDLIREVRTLPPELGGSTPAIALTAFARAEDRTRARLAGYQTHLSKPVEVGELLAAISSLASLPQSRG